MAHPTLGFIGGGRVARILLGGWQHAKTEIRQVLVCEPQDPVFARLEACLPGGSVVRAEATEAAAQELVFLAVHPPQLGEAAGQIASGLRSDAIVVSLAPKFTVARLAELLAGFSRLARLIPNAPSIVGRGYNPIAWSANLGDADRQTVRSLLQPLGTLPEVLESNLEAYAIVSAMGPTYFWPQWLELESLAEQFGLSPSEARQAVSAMTAGALAMLEASSLSADEVLDLIPVKPLADFEPAICQAYRSKLTALLEKIRP